MAQSVIFPNGPLFMVDRNWKSSHRGLGLKVVPLGGNKKPQIAGRGGPQYDPASGSSTRPWLEQAVLQVGTERSENAQKPKVMGNSGQNFQFVNIAGSFRDRDQETRKLVRSHVMKGTHRNQKPRRNGNKGVTNQSKKDKMFSPVQQWRDPETGLSTSTDLAPVLPGSATSFYGVIPCVMKPHFYSLLNYYLVGVSHALYPMDSHLTFNPVKTSWFPLAITDELLLHTILLSSAASLAFRKGGRQSTEASDIMKSVFRVLTSRLEDGSEMTDATIGAVSCLAMVEVMFGNYAKWKVHAQGLKEMVRTRGGLSSVAPELQMKICRADIEGAVDSVSAPHLPPITRSYPPIFSMMQPIKVTTRNNDLLPTLSSSDISPELRTTLLDLSQFSQAMDYAFSRPEVLLHPKAFDEDVISIQHGLLAAPRTPESRIATACRLGALIYIKTLTRENPFSQPTSTVVVRRLQRSLAGLIEEPGAAPLLLWLYFMGGIASEGLAARSWFADRLVDFVLLPGEVLTWASVRKSLQKVLWIEMTHEVPCRQLWDEVEINRALLDGASG